MFGLSLTEIIVIAILALVVFGPDRIPGIARTIGKTVRDMRKAASDVQRAFEVEEIRRELKAKNASTPQTTQPAARATLPNPAATPSPQANTSAAATAATAAAAVASAPPAPSLPQLRAPIQSVPALDTFSALRSAVSDAPDPLETLSDDEDAIADAEDAALTARLRAYLSPPEVAKEVVSEITTASPVMIASAATLTAQELPKRGTPKLLTIFRVVVKNAQPIPASATLTAVPLPARASVATSAPESIA